LDNNNSNNNNKNKNYKYQGAEWLHGWAGFLEQLAQALGTCLSDSARVEVALLVLLALEVACDCTLLRALPASCQRD
jgi:hypothetical protein